MLISLHLALIRLFNKGIPSTIHSKFYWLKLNTKKTGKMARSRVKIKRERKPAARRQIHFCHLQIDFVHLSLGD